MSDVILLPFRLLVIALIFFAACAVLGIARHSWDKRAEIVDNLYFYRGTGILGHIFFSYIYLFGAYLIFKILVNVLS